jgi:hypothetical protein
MRSGGSRLIQALAGFPPQAVKIKRYSRAAGFAGIPGMTKALRGRVLPFPLGLPKFQGFLDNLVGGRVLTGLHSIGHGSDLLTGQGNADFPNIRHISLQQITGNKLTRRRPFVHPATCRHATAGSQRSRIQLSAA